MLDMLRLRMPSVMMRRSFSSNIVTELVRHFLVGGGNSIAVFILSLLLLWQRYRAQKLQRQLDCIADMGSALQEMSMHQPPSARLVIGWARGTRKQTLSNPTPDKLRSACWLLSKADMAKFNLEILGVQRWERYINLHIAVRYDGLLVNPINVEDHHISLFQGEHCKHADVKRLEAHLAHQAQEWTISGFLSAKPCLFQTSMRVAVPKGSLDVILNFAEDMGLELYETAKCGFHVAL